MTTPRSDPSLRTPASESGYEFIRDIGSGGYGYVHLFETQSGDQKQYIAGKFIYQDVFGPVSDDISNAAYQRAFEGLQNFRSLTTQSPYLLQIYEVRARHDQGYFCYMMELADDVALGSKIIPSKYRPCTLKNLLESSGKRTRIPVKRTLKVATQLARGLEILHNAGFTHRDVRPSNIIFVRGTAKLADIDLVVGNDPTVASYIPKHYAAPEGSHSCQADIFSLGKCLYEMSTGLTVQSFPCLPSDIRHWDDHRQFLDLNRIIGKACARNVRSRYGSVTELLADLKSV